MPALNGKMECGRMTRRQELYHPLMCAPTNGDRLSLPQEAFTRLSIPNPPTPLTPFNTPASVGSGSVVVGWSVGGWISILRRKATKAASSCAAGQSFHSRGMGVASNLVRLSQFLKQSVFSSGLSLLQKTTYLGHIVAQCTVGQGGHQGIFFKPKNVQK